MIFWLNFLGILSFVLVEGFFSGSETAIISCDRLRLRQLARSGNWLAGLIEKLLERPDRLLSTTLVGTNLSVIISSSLMAGFLASKFGETKGPLLATLVMTPAILIFGEIIPKTIFRQYADFLATLIALPLMICYYLLSPVILLAVVVTNFFLVVTKEKKLKKNTFLSREEIAQFIEDRGKKEFFKEEKIDIINRIFDFEGKTVASVMVPFDQARLLPAGLTVAATLHQTENYKFSRFPVYEGGPENITGFLEIKELVAATKEQSINNFIKPLLFVPAYKKLEEMLDEFITEKAQIAGVVNETGALIGMVTREDLVEEVLGEIRDEFDK